jgi:hypothetical protein
MSAITWQPVHADTTRAIRVLHEAAFIERLLIAAVNMQVDEVGIPHEVLGRSALHSIEIANVDGAVRLCIARDDGS